MLLPLFKPSRIAWTVMVGFFPLRFWARTLAAMNSPWVSFGFAARAVSNAVSSAVGVVPSLEAIPVKLSATLGVAGWVGFTSGLAFGGAVVCVTFGAGFWATAVAWPPSPMSRTLRPRRDN